MKSPAEIVARLRRQWDSPKKREARLLHGQLSWPVVESIGRPKPHALVNDLDAVIEHNRRWKNIDIGHVRWEDVSYRATSEPVSVPVNWQLNKPTEWIAACQDKNISAEFSVLAALVENTDTVFHPLLIRRPSLWRTKALAEVIQTCQLASELTPGCAKGKPLRALSLAGIDTKFFERNARLIASLLDIRFEGEAGLRGLESFLDALPEGEHWLLLIDLDGELMPFRKQRVSSFELATAALPGTHILIIENETCQHQLPDKIANTLAILGAGLDLDWTRNPNLQQKQMAYWGDIDTWGLTCLARARKNVPKLTTLLMTAEVFARHKTATVLEPVVAGREISRDLNADERALYQQLVESDRGRLEQEYLPSAEVHAAVADWRGEIG